MEEKIRHLEMVQGVINRMAGNSFFLKGWMVTLVTAFFSLSDKDENTIYFLLVYIPIFIFWMLDAYYLRQERLYRNLYDLIRNIHPSKIDFSMDASIPLLHTKKTRYLSCFFSSIEVAFYSPIAILSLVIIQFIVH